MRRFIKGIIFSVLFLAFTAQVNASSINHKIVYKSPHNRYDGGGSFYVLIDPVDLSNNSFKKNITNLVSELVKSKGAKNSFEIHDNRESLNISYKQYGDMSLGRPRTKKEGEIIAIHEIASFTGNMETNVYKNTLTFFPAAFTSHPKVGKYVKTVEFNP